MPPLCLLVPCTIFLKVVDAGIDYIPIQRQRVVETIAREHIVPVEKVIQRAVPVPFERVVHNKVSQLYDKSPVGIYSFKFDLAQSSNAQ